MTDAVDLVRGDGDACNRRERLMKAAPSGAIIRVAPCDNAQGRLARVAR